MISEPKQIRRLVESIHNKSHANKRLLGKIVKHLLGTDGLQDEKAIDNTISIREYLEVVEEDLIVSGDRITDILEEVTTNNDAG